MLNSRMLLCACVFVTAIEAFSPNTFVSPRGTALSLTMKDGNDLVAASQRVYRPLHDEDEEEILLMETSLDEGCPSLITAPRSAAVSFVKRLFAQPSAAFHPHRAESLDDYTADEDAERDVVYFPVRAKLLRMCLSACPQRLASHTFFNLWDRLWALPLFVTDPVTAVPCPM